MKLKADTSVLNYGDTSFRRKKYLSEYRILLKLLSQHMENNQVWVKNSRLQSDYYTSVIDNTDLFNRNESTQAKMAKRGRTLTNSLVKTGLINEKREISPVGKAWLSMKLKPRDPLEKILNLSEDNLVFLRQWSKVRLYNKEGNHYFIPFMFMLNLLSHYRRIPKKDFLVFIHSIPPTLNDQQLNDLIQKYSDVANGKMNFNEFVDRYLDNQNLANVVDDVQKLLSSDNIDQDDFNKYFVNGKSTDSAGPIYLRFVKALINFRSKPTVARMKELVKQGALDKIKKAFGFGKNPFKFSKKREYTLDEFIDDNSDNDLINTSLGNIFVVFRNSKRDDLVHEYGDMTYRLTNLAGVISYSNNIVSLPLRPVFEKIFTSYDISMSGSENYKDFDLNFGSALYQQSTFLESLRLSDNQIDSVLKLVARTMGLDNYQEIAKEVEKQNNLRFEKLVRNKFPKTTVLELLQQFVSRKDDLIAKTVTDNAPIPDIFEYVLGLAWYYISNKKVNIRSAYNLSLDADFLPLSHAAGYQGDLEFHYENRTLLLEATLMDHNTQKRGELEPVIRHTVNLTIENGLQPTQTIFVASELDDNVMNIFRATQFIELNHSAKKGSTSGINIFALSISELIKLMKANINDRKILNIINNAMDSNPTQVKNNWRTPILESMTSL